VKAIYKALTGQGQDKNRCIRDELVRGDALVGVVADQPGGNSGSSLGKDDHEDGGQAVEPTGGMSRWRWGTGFAANLPWSGWIAAPNNVLRLVNA
jgi:hypothetical protein